MFQLYETKPVVKPALQITPNDIIHKFDDSTSIFERNGFEVKFSHTQIVVVGDYIIEQSERDVYHCPQDVFIEKYRTASMKNMTFGQAIEAAKLGNKIAREGWNGKNMFVVYMSGMSLPPYNTQGTERKVNDRTAKWIGEDKPLNSQPYFAMYNAQEEWIPGWLASQSDMLAEDWQIVE